MATVTKVIENADENFSEIVINGVTVMSANSNSQTPDTQENTTESPTEPEQGQDVNAINLNNILHNIRDSLATTQIQNLITALEAEVTARGEADTAIGNKIGNLDNLDTINKTSVVNAINELNTDIQQIPDGIVPKGTIAFANLPSLANVEIGWMYNISDDFTTTSDFITPGVAEKAGSNVYCADAGSGTKKWDVFAVAPDIVVDQSYDGTSTNPQSGTAVAGAVADKMDKTNPEGTGSFSMNRASGSVVGTRSSTLGYNNSAKGNYSHAEGLGTTASSNYQHVQGKYNVEDASYTYADIIGNGSSTTTRENIEATTWAGDKRIKGDFYYGCNDDSTGGTSVSGALASKVNTSDVSSSVTSGDTNPVSSGGVHSALSNFFKIDRLKDADCSTVDTTYSLDTGKKFTDYDFIMPVVTFLGSDQIQTPIIPQTEVQVSINQSKSFIYTAGVTSQARRISFMIVSETTFKITLKDGTSGSLPHCWGFYGIKFGLS